jgi:hypothetical protein
MSVVATHADPSEVDSTTVERIISEVAGHTRRAGHGPTIGQLQETAGLSSEVLGEHLRTLVEAGQLRLARAKSGLVRVFPGVGPPDDQERDLVAFVADYRAAHGQGPTWKEAWAAVGWWPLPSVRNRTRGQGGELSWAEAHRAYMRDCRQLEARMRRLFAGGWLTATREARSLNLGPQRLPLRTSS